MSSFRTPVLFIELFDSLPGQPQQRFVLRQRFFERVSKVGQQAEVQMVVPICQETDFQRIDQILDVLNAREHSRDYHQSARFRRNPFGEVHSRQRMRRRQQRGQPVHQRPPPDGLRTEAKESRSARAASHATRRHAPSPPTARRRATVISRIVPPYSSKGNRRPALRRASKGDERTSAVRSSCANPLSIR